MLDRERRGDAVGRGHLHLHPSWLQLLTADGQLLYMHRLRPQVLSDRFYTAPVGGTCGGFLCDEMGLGKTLQSLMLIMRWVWGGGKTLQSLMLIMWWAWGGMGGAQAWLWA